MTAQFVFKVSHKFLMKNVFIYLQDLSFYNEVYKMILFYKTYFKKPYHTLGCLLPHDEVMLCSENPFLQKRSGKLEGLDLNATWKTVLQIALCPS